MRKQHPSAIAMLALCWVSAAASARHAGSFERSVPSYLVAAARRGPLELAVVLAEESIPAGIEVRESDDVYPPPFPQSERDRTLLVSLSEVARAFNESHREYRASVTDGVFVIRLADSMPRLLDERSMIETPVVITGVMDAERAVFAQSDSRLRGPAIRGGIGRRAAEGLRARITLSGSGKSIAETLNEIVRQVPGAWQVTTFKVGREWRIAKFGFIYPDRSRSMHPLAVR